MNYLCCFIESMPYMNFLRAFQMERCPLEIISQESLIGFSGIPDGSIYYD